jgi:hypothetical protein
MLRGLLGLRCRLEVGGNGRWTQGSLKPINEKQRLESRFDPAFGYFSLDGVLIMTIEHCAPEFGA